MDFFAGFTSIELIGVVLAGIFGVFPGLKLFSWVKAKLNLEDQWAHYMVLASSLLLTGGAMYVTSELSIEGFEFSLGNILAFGGVLYAASQVAYKRLNI